MKIKTDFFIENKKNIICLVAGLLIGAGVSGVICFVNYSEFKNKTIEYIRDAEAGLPLALQKKYDDGYTQCLRDFQAMIGKKT